ncbi:MAG: hypothetical protein E6G33_12450 [Actinobacteria bacterium]|nr:MAG: hypothetical protein E6G33_12450 [Actinomycetota bacterium]
MRAQPSRRSSTATGSPRRSSVTRSAWSLGSARTAATSTEQSTSTRAESRGLLTLGPGFSQVPGTVPLVLPSNICSLRLAGMQLRLDSADRLVELVEERRGPVFAEEAARRLFAIRHAPVGLARSLLDEVVGEDARLAWCGDAVGLADPPGADIQLEDATFVVVDLETTGLRPGSSHICEIGAVRVRGFELEEDFQLLVDPGVPLAPAISALTGLHDAELRGQAHPSIAVRRFLEFAGDSVLVAHNARFDLAFLDRETERLTGARLAGPVVDTVGLARRLLSGRTPRAGLAMLAQFFGTEARPCHRALPDAQATAEILVQLIGLAQERGARTVAELVELAAPRVRKVYAKRTLAFGAPSSPGVYLFRDRHDQVLYVGRARDLRARLARTSGPIVSVRRWRLRCLRSSGSSGESPGPSSKRRWRNCACSASSGPLRTRATHAPIGTCTSDGAATSSSALRRRRSSGRCEAGHAHGWHAGRSTAHPRRSSIALSWRCLDSVSACATSRTAAATKMRHASATASRRWSSWSATSRGSSGCVG